MLDFNGVSWYSVLGGTALKSPIILAVALVVTFCLRRKSAAARHLVWSAAFASLLLMPILSLVLPALRVPVSPAAFPLTITFRTNASNAAAMHPLGASTPTRAVAGYTPEPTEIDWPLLFIGLWMTGAALAFAQMLGSWIALRRLKVRAITCPEVLQVKHELGIQDDVEVLETAAGRMPMTFGLLKKRVLLPADAAQWSAERRRVVLLHELAHVRRGDSTAHLLGRIVVNLHWWNPLAWFAWRASIQERERAADDLVLSVGARASDYANHLLEIARSMQPGGNGAVAVAMARRSQLEGRLVSILDSAVNRNIPGKTSTCAAILLALALIVPLAAVNAQEVQSAASPAVEPLQKKLDALRTVYKETHPEVVRVKTEIAQAQRLGIPEPPVDSLRKQLDELRTIYTDSHPRVVRLKAELAQARQNVGVGTAELNNKRDEVLRKFDDRLTPAERREREDLHSDVAARAASAPTSREYGLALSRLGDWYRRRAELSQAQEFYLKAVSVLGDRADAVPALIGLGVEALIRKEQGQATEYFKKAQLLDPARAGAAMMWMAVVRHQQNNTSEAESLFKGALAVQDVNSVDAAVTMDLYATFLRVENRADEALAMQERSAAIRKSYMSKNAPAAAATVHKIGGGVTPPSLVFKVEPAYSEEARVAKFQGTSVLSVEIGPDGIARNTRIVRWLGLGLDEKAIEAISRWRFKPGMKDGQPVTVSATIEVNFRLL